MADYISYLPHVNACLNSTSAVLLVAGYFFIKSGNISAHRVCQVSALTVSIVFLASYLTYHFNHGTTRFQGTGFARTFYFTVLTSHTILAVVIVPLVVITFYRAFRLDFVRHRKIARITLPLWLYVSITGVIVYLMLYQIYPFLNMPDNGNHPETKVAEQARRTGVSWPILLLAALFLVATFLAWYFTWFGRGLSDTDISKYLSDTKNPRHVQHALLQIQQRIERKDPSAKNWYPQIESLSSNPETEFRLTIAWLMGFDNQSQGFHDALLRLVRDEQPLVRRNAALALVRFNDSTGRLELVSVLKPYPVKSNAKGVISSTLKQGSEVSRGTLLARVEEPEGKSVEVRAPLPGRVNELVKISGSQVNQEDVIVMLNSDEDSVWEALRGLALIGTSEDLNIVQSFINSSETAERVKEQAKRTANTIASRQGK